MKPKYLSKAALNLLVKNWKKERNKRKKDLIFEQVLKNVEGLLWRSIRKIYCGQATEHTDAYQVACMSVVRAMEKFQPEKNVKFTTYLPHWTKHFLIRHLQATKGVVYVPNHKQELVYRARRDNGEVPPELEHCAPKYIYTDRKGALDELLSNPNPLVDRVRQTFGLEHHSDKTVESLIEHEELERLKRYCEKLLTPRDKQVLTGRIEGKTLDEIGKDLGLSRERVRQVETEFTRRLKIAARQDARKEKQLNELPEAQRTT